MPASLVILFAVDVTKVYNAARYYFNFNTGPILLVKLEVKLEVKLQKCI